MLDLILLILMLCRLLQRCLLLLVPAATGARQAGWRAWGAGRVVSAATNASPLLCLLAPRVYAATLHAMLW